MEVRLFDIKPSRPVHWSIDKDFNDFSGSMPVLFSCEKIEKEIAKIRFTVKKNTFTSNDKHLFNIKSSNQS